MYVCGSFFRIIPGEKICTYSNTIGNRNHKFKLDFRPGVFNFQFMRFVPLREHENIWYSDVFWDVEWYEISKHVARDRGIVV